MSFIPGRSALMVFLIILAGACSTSQLTITLLKPASVTLPASIKRISIFPMPGQVSDTNSIENIDDIKLHSSADVTQILLGYLNGIYDVLVNSPLFERVVFSDSTYVRFMDQGRLYWEDLRTVCTHDTTDVVLILHKVVINDSLLLSEYEGSSLYYNIYRIDNYTKWSFVQPFQERILITLEDEDSLALDGMFGERGEAEHFLYKACYTSGVMTGGKMSPVWQDRTRTYFTRPGRDMKDAAGFVEKNRWYNATKLWDGLVESGNRRTASRASYNIALAFEMNDDLEQAYSWIMYADSLRSGKHILLYRNILDERIKIKPILDQQFTGK